MKNIEFTHWYEPPSIPSYAELCIVLKSRGGLAGFLFGNRRILTDRGEVFWVRDADLMRKYL